MNNSVAEAVAKWADEVAEQQALAEALVEAIRSMGVDIEESVDKAVILDALAVEGLRLAPMDSSKNIASLAYFDMLLPKT